MLFAVQRKTNYYAKLLSCSGLAVLAIYFLALAVPFYLSFGAEPFWNKLKLSSVKQHIQPTGEYLLVLYHQDSTTTSFLSSTQLSALEGNTLTTALQIGLSAKTLTGKLVLPNSQPNLHKVELYLPCVVKSAYGQTPAFSYSANALLASRVGGSTSRISFVGSLTASPSQPLDSNSKHQDQLDPFLKVDGTPISTPRQFIQARQLLPMQISAEVESFVQAGSLAPTPLQVEFKLAVGPQFLAPVKLSYATTLKLHWATYLGLAVPALWVCWQLLRTLFGEGHLGSRVRHE